MIILILLTLALLSIAICLWIYLPKILKELKSLTSYLEDTLFKEKKLSKEQKKENRKIEKANQKFRVKQEQERIEQIERDNKRFNGY